jgi:hypothetical protein
MGESTEGETMIGPFQLNNSDRASLVQAIHAAPGKIVLAVTGGGVQAITDLLLMPGASRTVLEVSVPYAGSALAELTGVDDGAVSTSTAEAMALACYSRAMALSGEFQSPGVVAGVACTAALVTDRERRGADRACLAVVDAEGTTSWDVSLSKAGPENAVNGRVSQDRMVADSVLRAIATAVGVPAV